MIKFVVKFYIAHESLMDLVRGIYWIVESGKLLYSYPKYKIYVYLLPRWIKQPVICLSGALQGDSSTDDDNAEYSKAI